MSDSQDDRAEMHDGATSSDKEAAEIEQGRMNKYVAVLDAARTYLNALDNTLATGRHNKIMASLNLLEDAVKAFDGG